MTGKQQPKSLAWRRRLVLLLILVVAASIVARVATAKEAPAAAGRAPAGGSGLAGSLVPGDQPGPAPTPEPEAQGPAKDVLPYLTEGGIAMLIGIALGMATRTAAKILVLLFALFFIGVQFLSAKGIVDIDWSAFTTWLRQFVLNISGDKGLGAIVQHKLPSAGSLVIGYYLGLKKG